MGIIKVIGSKDGYKGAYINTTSRSNDWGKQLSPFFLGPINLYNGHKSINLENAWQFSKVYKEHVDESGNPTKDYYDWAKNGWNSSFAYRYPMGKGAVPLYSLWEYEKLTYLEARKKIYLPLYARAVTTTQAFSILKQKYERGDDIILWDFDGYDHEKLGMTIDDVINSENRKMGHAFVIYMLLTGKIIVKDDKVIVK